MVTGEFSAYFKKRYHRTSSFLSGFIIMCADAVSLFLCIGLSFFIVNLIAPSQINFRSFVYYSVYIPLILMVYYAAGLYPGIMISPAEEVRKLCLCSFFCFAGISISILMEGGDGLYVYLVRRVLIQDSRSVAVCTATALSIPLATIWMPSSREIMRHISGRKPWWGVPAVVYRTEDAGNDIVDRLLARPDLGYRPAVIIDCGHGAGGEYRGIPVFPPDKEILAAIRRLNIKVAILCDYEEDLNVSLSPYRYVISVFKRRHAFTNTAVHLRDMGGIIGFSSTNNLTRRGNLFVKRLIDLFLLLISAALVLPLTLVIAVIVKCTSPGPVFYGHSRIGKNGRPIKCWKFRSMYADADKMLEKILAENPEMRAEWERDQKFVNDPRVTKFGRLLRKTSMDELPQFWNILRGEMSFVGPRPVTKEELAKYGDNAGYILSVTPGLSGMWQISGRSNTGYEERVNLDTYYIQNWSVWLDLWIILKTIWVVIKGKGAY